MMSRKRTAIWGIPSAGYPWPGLLTRQRFLEALLYQARPNDPITPGVLAAGLLGICLLASYIPARRATRVDPWTSLRVD